MRLQEALGDVVGSDPAVATIAMAIGAGGSSVVDQQRPHVHHAEAEGSSATPSADEIIARLRPKLDKIEGAKLFLQAAQDVNVGGRALAHAIPVHAAGRRPRRAERVGAEDPRQAEDAARAARRGDRPADGGDHPHRRHQPRPGGALRPHAAGDRRHAVRRVRPAAGRAVLHPAEQLPRRHGGPARACRADPASLDKIYIRSPATGQLVPLAAFAKWTTRDTKPLSISHQGQFPAVTISFNLAQGVSLGTATQAIQAAERELELPASLRTSYPGQRPGVPGLAQHRAVADRRGAGRRLSHPGHPLRELHPPDHHPVDAAVGRRRRARDADAVRLRLQSRCHDRRHPARSASSRRTASCWSTSPSTPSRRSTCRRRRPSARPRCCASARS